MKRILMVLLSVLMVVGMTSCENDHGLNPHKPVTLSIWHNYGGQMKEAMQDMIDEFNETIGEKKGIILNVTSITTSASLHEKLSMAAKDDPGAPELPDITTANPKTAVLLAERGMLADLKEQFTEKELSAYVPRFLEEGQLGTESLYIFPTAKSTEVLFINKVIFDRFAAENGASYRDLATFEGLAETARKYYEWTDAKTPDVPNDGKKFYHSDSLYNYTQIGCRQLGAEFVKENQLDGSTPEARRVWNSFYEQAVKGEYAVFDGYSSDLVKTGEIVCSTGSTAGVVFFDSVVTYPDNTTEPAELITMPYPVFEGGKKIAVQRGGGMAVTKSDDTKEYAASLFLKWFTSPENNIRFISQTGYLPVTNEAYDEIMNREISQLKDERIRALLDTAVTMQKEYDFYIPPVFDGFNSLSSRYGKDLLTCLKRAREQYLALLETESPEDAYSRASQEALEAFRQQR